MDNNNIDHLFRHHSGKMVSVLIRIFGFTNLEIIEDAVQDTFLKVSISWRTKQPENPEAWLTQAAKNRVVDIFRKLKSETNYSPNLTHGIQTIAISELFLDTEIEDAQLRMIFTACHPKLDPRDRISFALKTVSGFSIKEIASALLTKEDTIKKRLSRARKSILKNDLRFRIPQGKMLQNRLESVMEVLYLIFNEGFHSNSQQQLIRKDLCGEAMRLCQLLLKRESLRTPDVYALFALMCFHSSRLDAKINSENELLDLKHQDRSLWHFPLIALGNSMMNKAVETTNFSHYHFESAIAAEHLQAKTFKDTNWNKILYWYEQLNQLQPMPIHVLTMAVICVQNSSYKEAESLFNQLNPEDFAQRMYLFYAAKSDYFYVINNCNKAIKYLDLAINTVTNSFEKAFLEQKKLRWLNTYNF
ncbi:RNA polymerase sigma factor [Psychroserpens damuponensis]|uniref:RNA polymerase sigma factor n=1 Tax=Psychroserpens damuponensis TaxID=943936 RepID=UPI00058EC94E|nr:sigma-70 family RNA polymerase sigma factor [Psychroserpens damuponensis]